MRLKAIVSRERFDWVAFDESRPLPVSVPSMPLKLKVILVGERESLADFQEMEPELAEQAIYSEFEDNLQIADAEAMTLWCQWVTRIALRDNLPPRHRMPARSDTRGCALYRRTGYAASLPTVDSPPV